MMEENAVSSDEEEDEDHYDMEEDITTYVELDIMPTRLQTLGSNQCPFLSSDQLYNISPFFTLTFISPLLFFFNFS
jgi:hypothetical protein